MGVVSKRHIFRVAGSVCPLQRTVVWGRCISVALRHCSNNQPPSYTQLDSTTQIWHPRGPGPSFATMKSSLSSAGNHIYIANWRRKLPYALECKLLGNMKEKLQEFPWGCLCCQPQCQCTWGKCKRSLHDYWKKFRPQRSSRIVSAIGFLLLLLGFGAGGPHLVVLSA